MKPLCRLLTVLLLSLAFNSNAVAADKCISETHELVKLNSELNQELVKIAKILNPDIVIKETQANTANSQNSASLSIVQQVSKLETENAELKLKLLNATNDLSWYILYTAKKPLTSALTTGK